MDQLHRSIQNRYIVVIACKLCTYTLKRSAELAVCSPLVLFLLEISPIHAAFLSGIANILEKILPQPYR